MFRYFGINYNTIKLIRQILLSSNIGKKVRVNSVIINIAKVDIIK